MAGLTPRESLRLEQERGTTESAVEAESLHTCADWGLRSMDGGGRLHDGTESTTFEAGSSTAKMGPAGGISSNDSSSRKRHVQHEPTQGAEPPAGSSQQ